VTAADFVLLAAAGGGAATGGATTPGLTPADIAVLAIVIASIVFFGGATVLALGWAFRDGQFDNFQQGALSIFGPDEPVGEATDSFPGQQPPPRDTAERCHEEELETN
jgi:cbb3-type cytochrome oxidase maturation protein